MDMNFTFLSNSIHNSTIVDGATGTVLFNVTTPESIGKRTTTVTNSFGEIVAVYKRKWGPSADQVTIRGETVGLHEWLPNNAIFAE